VARFDWGIVQGLAQSSQVGSLHIRVVPVPDGGRAAK
jgi:hypothetical protein